MTTTIPGHAHLESTTLAAAQLDFRDGTRYVYSGVGPDLYRGLLSAVSKGSFFNRHIRGHFPYAKLSAKTKRHWAGSPRSAMALPHRKTDLLQIQSHQAVTIAYV